MDQIYLLLDGELSPERCTLLKVHLQLCTACYGRVETERLFKDLLKDRCGCETAPPELVTRIRFALQVEATGGE